MSAGNEKLWAVLQEKMEQLPASSPPDTVLKLAHSLVEVTFKAFVPTDPRYATTYEQAADLYSKAGQFDEAEHLYIRARDGFLQMEPTDPTGLWRTLRNLAETQLLLGKERHAEKSYEQCILLAQEIFDIADPQMLVLLNRLGDLYVRCSKLESAESIYVQALKLAAEVASPGKHAPVMEQLHILGAFYCERELHEKALPVYKRLLKLLRDVFEETHPDIARTSGCLAVVYHSLGNFTKAAEFYDASLRGLELHQDSAYSEEYLTFSTHYASMLRENNDFKGADKLENKTRKMLKKFAIS